MITNPFSHIGRQFGALSDDPAGKRHDSGHQAAAVGPAADTVGAMVSEPRSEEHALRSKFMLIFRGGAVSRCDLSPSELQAHVEKWYRWSDEPGAFFTNTMLS
jgi:hypothetical protein